MARRASQFETSTDFRECQIELLAKLLITLLGYERCPDEWLGLPQLTGLHLRRLMVSPSEVIPSCAFRDEALTSAM
jgi:hypothetical protein